MNVVSLAASPSDPDTVYAEGLNITDLDAGAGNAARHVWRSTDGHTFRSLFDGAQALLYNGNPLAVAPTDPDVYTLHSGTWPPYNGVFVYRYDGVSGKLAVNRTFPPHANTARAIAVSPIDPDLVYVGLGLEVHCEPVAC